jgi:ribosomal protein L16 Arg81 hydroxylase
MHNHNHVFSDVNAVNPDYNRTPDYKKATPIEVEVGPGDLLFIPIGWWHSVVSLTKNISLSFTNFNLSFNGFIDFPMGNNRRY